MVAEGNADSPTKIRVPTPTGFLQFGPGVMAGKQVVGFKVWANAGTPLRGVMNFLYDLSTGELLALIQAYLLTKIRTAAVTSVAVRALTPSSPASVGMYGAGKQADAQLAAICAVREVTAVHVYSRTPDRLREFCRRTEEKLGVEVVPCERPEMAARDKDIIVTVTSAHQPILFRDWITRPGLVIGQGANHWYERELEAELVQAAKLIVVDDKGQAKADGGDLLWPVSHGKLSWRNVVEIGEVLAGQVALPAFDKGLILFKSHGIGLEDVAVSKAVFDLARARGIGLQLPI
jgi:ornithine cyclodeaminase